MEMEREGGREGGREREGGRGGEREGEERGREGEGGRQDNRGEERGGLTSHHTLAPHSPVSSCLCSLPPSLPPSLLPTIPLSLACLLPLPGGQSVLDSPHRGPKCPERGREWRDKGGRDNGARREGRVS